MLEEHKRYRQVWSRRPGDAAKSSPAFMIAGFLHLALLVALSFWTIAVHLERDYQPVDVTLRKQKVVTVTAGTQQEEAALNALADATKRDLEMLNESATDDPFHEARGDASGQVNVFGAGGGGRSGVGRGGRIDRRGGASKASDGALQGGLEWLARHRTDEGVWIALKQQHQDPEAGEASPFKGGDLAQTGLALLCFLCADHGPEKAGPYQGLVQKAEDWLIRRVGARGTMRKLNRRRPVWQYAYEHAICTLALSECLARRKTPSLEKAVARAVKFILNSQTKLGWRYGYGRADSDTSVTSWMLLALKSAEHAGVSVPEASYEKVRAWLDAVSNDDGTTHYMPKNRITPAMNASGLFMRVVLGEKPTTQRNRLAAQRVGRSQLVIKQGGIENFYHVYYAALAMYQVGGDLWRAFNPRIRDGLVSTSRKGRGCERGSWKGVGFINEPVLSTAFATLTLETYYRYLPVHEGIKHDAPGAVTQAEDLSEGERLLGNAEVALSYARKEGASPGEVLAAEAAYARALGALEAEEAKWSLREEALVRLVELAALGKDRARVMQAVEAYLAALPSGQTADPKVLRVRRLERFGAVFAQVRAALTGKEAEPRRAAEAAALALEQELEREVHTIKKWSDERREAEELVARLTELRTQLAFADDPKRAIREGWEQVAHTRPKGPLSRVERRLCVALLLHASERFAVAVEERDERALVEGEQAIVQLDQRRMELRMPPEERARVQPMAERARVSFLAALLTHQRYARAADAAGGFHRRYPESTFREQAETVERGALSQLVRQGRADERQRARLNEILVRYARRKPDLGAGERLALAELLERAGNAALALEQLREVVTGADAKLRPDALLRMARIARRDGRVADAHGLLDQIGAGGQDRLDVMLERCRCWRDNRKSSRALAEYLQLLQVLTGKEVQSQWWQIAYEAGEAYVECGQIEAARHFLEELRKKDRRFGGDEALRSKFLQLMREVDVM